MIVLYIAIGGAAGAVARYWVGGWVQDRAGLGIPVGTLVVNVVGCLLIGFCLPWFEGLRISPEVRALVAVGMLGAFTTFSTYSFETVALIQNGALGRAAGYATGSVVVGIAAVYVGAAIAAGLLQGRG